MHYVIISFKHVLSAYSRDYLSCAPRRLSSLSSLSFVIYKNSVVVVVYLTIIECVVGLGLVWFESCVLTVVYACVCVCFW